MYNCKHCGSLEISLQANKVLLARPLSLELNERALLRDTFLAGLGASFFSTQMQECLVPHQSCPQLPARPSRTPVRSTLPSPPPSASQRASRATTSSQSPSPHTCGRPLFLSGAESLSSGVGAALRPPRGLHPRLPPTLPLPRGRAAILPWPSPAALLRCRSCPFPRNAPAPYRSPARALWRSDEAPSRGPYPSGPEHPLRG